MRPTPSFLSVLQNGEVSRMVGPIIWCGNIHTEKAINKLVENIWDVDDL